MNFRLARVGASSARRDNILAGQAGCVLDEYISGLSSSRVSPFAKQVGCLAKRVPLAEWIYLAKRVISYLNLLFFGPENELDSTLSHKKWSLYSIKSHNQEKHIQFLQIEP